jgi:hypothetical protein
MNSVQPEARIPGRIVISWTMSGGILFGMVGTFLTMTQRLPGYDFFITLGGLYLFGSLAGLVHGTILGVFAKSRETPFKESFKRVLIGMLGSLLTGPIGFLVTLWIGFALYYQLDPTFGRLLGAVVGAWIGLAVLMWTAWETWQAVRIIVGAWPDFVMVAGLTGIVFLVLVWFLNSFYPYVFGASYTLSQAIFIAGGASVLGVGPLATLASIGLRKVIQIQRLLSRLEHGRDS